MDVDAAIANQLKNIETRAGKSLAELQQILEKANLEKFSEKRDFLKTELGMGHGDANMLIHHFAGAKDATDNPLAEIYAGPKAPLLAVHQAVIGEIEKFGDFEIAPKKGYVSLRRKKQFAMVGPATKTQIEIGLNMKGVPATSRLIEVPAGGMCQYKTRIAAADEVDPELVGWLRTAFDSAG